MTIKKDNEMMNGSTNPTLDWGKHEDETQYDDHSWCGNSIDPEQPKTTAEIPKTNTSPGSNNKDDDRINNNGVASHVWLSDKPKTTKGCSPNQDQKCFMLIVVGLAAAIGFILILVFFGGNGGSSNSSSSGYVATGGTGGSRGSCFPAGERVLLVDGSADIPIEQLEPGTLIHQGHRVMANMKLAANFEEDPLYRYNNSVYVTGSHLVEEMGGWKPVSDSDLASSLQGGGNGVIEDSETPSFVYNLITTDHKLVVNNTVFADWEEWENTVENWALESRILMRLNNGHIDHHLPSLAPSDPVGEGAFAPSTPVLLSDGSSVPIEDVQPGQRLYDDDEPNYVFAVMQLYLPDDTVIYRYGNTVATEWAIVQDNHDGFWRNLKYSMMEDVSVIGLAAEYGSVWYQLWTTNHMVPIDNNQTFADYHIIDEDDPIFSTEEKLQVAC